MTQQAQIDSSRIAALIEKNAELYQISAEYRFMVNGTRFLTPEETHASMHEIGGDLFREKN
jgi:hypothetical protein